MPTIQKITEDHIQIWNPDDFLSNFQVFSMVLDDWYLLLKGPAPMTEPDFLRTSQTRRILDKCLSEERDAHNPKKHRGPHSDIESARFLVPYCSA
jgi:hypothetical protein